MSQQLQQVLDEIFNPETDIPLQETSFNMWDEKYRLKSATGDIIDQDVNATYTRIAKALAMVEDEPRQKASYQDFLWALQHGAIPAGRIIANAGAQQYKPKTSTINCTVSRSIRDSMDDILTANHMAGLTLKSGAGIGYEFSTLRPRGAFVKGAGALTSGPLSFMDIFDKTCFTISSAGGRRGAQMATFDIAHPDIMEFIRAKREDGRLRQFNLSCLISDDFMQAVADDADWHLAFPAFSHETHDPTIKILYRDWPVIEDAYTVNQEGKVACRVYKTVKAKRLWDIIMTSNYDFAEPGFILIDEVNRMNNNWFCEYIRASNPCGEQMLPPNGSCLLGSINLTRFIKQPFTDNAFFDFEEYKKVITIFTRMLDNVVEINGLPLAAQRDELIHKRRHGMGFLGLGSALTMLKIPYGSAKSLEFTEEVSKVLALTGYEAGIKLAIEKGSAPIMEEEFEITPLMIRQRPELVSDGYQAGDKVKAKILWAGYSQYFKKFPLKLRKELMQHGCRFTHHTSIAPTGTTALSLGNNVSNGIEPSFSHQYKRNIIRTGKKTKEQVSVHSYEYQVYQALIAETAIEDLPAYFTTADEISPRQHIDIQAAAQRWIDSSISKTANVPTDISYEEFKDIYRYAYENGLKGCTTFRFNPENFQGVLVKETDLANTTYIFTLEDGTEVKVKGNEEIEYDGETHTAANLYDALKEGYYGKF